MGFMSYFVASLSLATVVYAKSNDSACTDKLVILSPNSKSTQVEFVEAYKEHYFKTYNCKVEVDLLYQGGSDALKLIDTRFKQNPASADIDIFWGGGEHPHYEMDRRGLLQAYKISPELRKQVPSSVAGVALYNDKETWHAAALSSFGIFYNKSLLDKLKLPHPSSWDDLGDSRFMDHLSNADPRRSSSNVTMTMVILQGLGWQKGWELLTAIAANTRSFTHTSSDPIKAVITGDALASMSVGFYANAKIGELGTNKLGYNFPESKSIINPDPISILKGAKNTQAAERFVEFVLSVAGQKLFLLPQGVAGGPKHATLARMSVNRQAYEDTKGTNLSEFNPFALKISPMMLNVDRVTELQFIFADLLGAIHIDTHKDLKKAWQQMIKRGNKAEERAELAAPPISEAEFTKLAKQWNDSTVRNKTINEWVSKAGEKYRGFLLKK